MNSSNKYRDGKIYKIQCKNDDTLTYIGSTIRSLRKRFKEHTYDAKCFPNRLFYKNVLQSKNKWDDWFIELVEEYPCDSSKELREREEHHIVKMGYLNSGASPVSYKNATTKFCRFLTDKETTYHCPCGRKISSQKYMCNHVKNKGHKAYENDFLINFLFERFKLNEDEAKSALKI